MGEGRPVGWGRRGGATPGWLARALRPPAGLLARTRWLFARCGVAYALVTVLLIVLDEGTGRWRWVGVCGAAWLAVSWGLAYRRGAGSTVQDALDALGLFAAWSLPDVDRSVTLAYFGISFLALTGSRTQAVRRAVLYGSALVAVAVLAPGPGEGMSQSALVPQLAVMALVTVLMRMFGSTLASSERAREGEELLARTGTKLLGAARYEQVADCGVQALHELCAGRDLDAVLAVSSALGVAGPDGELVVAGGTIELAQWPAGTALPDSASAVLGAGVLPESAPRVWELIPLTSRGSSYGVLLVQAEPGLLDEVRATLTALAVQLSFALGSSAAAWHDALTGLPNRALFTEAIAAAQARHGGDGLAVLFIDLDGFKQVNDTRGHAAGDQLLLEVATRVRHTLRGEDVAARLGGDEFAVLLAGVEGAREAQRIADRLAAQLVRPVRLPGGAELTVAGSVGVALGRAGLLPEQLLQRADQAMYDAKSRGRGGVRIYDEDVPALQESGGARVGQ